jgi:hypothetical protein
MTRYTADEEGRIRMQARVREWTRSGLLDPSQAATLAGELRVDARRTNIFLRVVLALFTWLIVAASIALVMMTNRVETDTPLAMVTGISALACVALAEFAIGQFRLYRFGVEEALAVAAAVLAGVSASFFPANPFEVPRIVVGLAVGVACGAAVYLRFGYVYAALGALAAAVAIPFQLDLRVSAQHAIAAVLLLAAFVLARSKRLHYRDDYPGDDYGVIQAAAWAGLYAALNVRLTADLFDGRFYWFTYAATWLLPVVGLYLSLRSRDRPLLDVSLVMALLTLITNKPYLGREHREWDPILLGVLLVGVALAVRRWLGTGADGQRGGFTSSRVLHKDGALLNVVSTAAVVYQPGSSSPPKPSDTTDFSGGRSGGAGGGASF